MCKYLWFFHVLMRSLLDAQFSHFQTLLSLSLFNKSSSLARLTWPLLSSQAAAVEAFLSSSKLRPLRPLKLPKSFTQSDTLHLSLSPSLICTSSWTSLSLSLSVRYKDPASNYHQPPVESEEQGLRPLIGEVHRLPTRLGSREGGRGGSKLSRPVSSSCWAS